MEKNIHARDAQLRAISVFTKRPEAAQVLNCGSAEVHDGLRCTYANEGHQLVIDMPSAIGGTDDGLTPGFYGRAAICSCLAIGIKMTATREDLHLETVEVGIEQDWDNRGVLAMDGASPVPSDTRIAIMVKSTEPNEVLKEMIDRAMSGDPWFLAFKNAQPVQTHVSFASVPA